MRFAANVYAARDSAAVNDQLLVFTSDAAGIIELLEVE